jgi:hypothetical protein
MYGSNLIPSLGTVYTSDVDNQLELSPLPVTR